MMDFYAFYLQHEYHFAAVQLTLAMLGMGATLELRDFSRVFSAPHGMVLGFLLQMAVVPLLAWLFIATVVDDPGLAIGLALCAAVAGGTASNILTYLARANAALSIVLTTVSTLACLVVTPWVLRVLIADWLPADVQMPTERIAMEIGLYLLAPLFLGMVLLRVLPRQAPWISRVAVSLSLLTVGLIVAGAHGSGRLDLEAFGDRNTVIVIAFVLVLTVVSVLLPTVAGLAADDVAAINIEVTVRNINLALLIKASLFPAVAGVKDSVGDNALFAVLFYGGLSLMVGPVLFALHRYRLRATTWVRHGPAAGGG